MPGKFVGYFLVLVVLLWGAYYLVQRNNAVGNSAVPEAPKPLSYASAQYAFSFSYPASLALEEYTPNYVSLYDETTDPRTLIVNVSVELSREYDQASSTFAAFAEARAINYCAADGPTGSIWCTKTTRSEPFAGSSGASGTVIYLEMMKRMGTTTTMREAGPFYIFDITKNASSTKYAALIVRPGDFYSEGAAYDAGAKAANDIVNSLRIDTK